MIDDKKTEAIEWESLRGRMRLYKRLAGEPNTVASYATEVDIRAAGYVPAAQLAEAIARLTELEQRLVRIAELDRLAKATEPEALIPLLQAMSPEDVERILAHLVEHTVMEAQLTEATAKLEAAEGLLEAERQGRREAFRAWNDAQNQRDHALSNLKTKLEAAERAAGRMHYLGNLVRSRSSEEQAEMNALMRRYPVQLEPAPEAAKPAESPCEEPFACSGDMDATIPWDEPASPPSQAAVPEQAAGELHGPLTASGSRVRVNLPESENHGAMGHIAEKGKTEDFAWRVSFDVGTRNEGDVWFRTEHLESVAPRPPAPQPPRADGSDVLTVEGLLAELLRALRIAKSRHEDGVPGVATDLINELERAQKGGGK